MLLTIDIGNSQTVLGLFEGEEIVEHWRVSTDPQRTADEHAVLLQGLMNNHPLVGDGGVDGIALCSTVPSVLQEMRDMIRRYYGDIPSLVVEPGVAARVSAFVCSPSGKAMRSSFEGSSRASMYDWSFCGSAARASSVRPRCSTVRA